MGDNLEFREPGEHTSSGYTSGSPSQPEPYTEIVADAEQLVITINSAILRDIGSYRADTGELVIELWFSDKSHFRIFAKEVQEVNE